MNVASLTLCKELLQLSGWDNIGNGFCWTTLADTPYLIADTGSYVDTEYPAYDAGFLLRQLPYQNHSCNLELRPRYDRSWYAGYSAELDMTVGDELDYVIFSESDTPEDALAKLAIELIKQGVIQPANKEGK